MTVVWRGTQEESLALVNAIAHSCECEFGMGGARIKVCASHKMMTNEQSVLDKLLFYRRINERLKEEEGASG